MVEIPAGPLPYPGGVRLELDGAAVTAWRAPDLGAQTAILGGLSHGTASQAFHLLRAAIRHLGVQRILGPMEGSTWAGYRFTLPDEGPADPPFAGEPEGADLPIWLEAGFRPAAFYQSRVASLPVCRPRSQALPARLAKSRIAVREATPTLELLRSLFELSGRTFDRNPFYRPVSFELFHALHGQARGELLLLTAEAAERGLQGFALAYADSAEPTRLVLKTLASAPEAHSLGLGAHLADELHARAAERGFRSMVHALMHEDNASLRLSHRFQSRLLRRYALLEWRPR